jgi:hypothetical protein
MPPRSQEEKERRRLLREQKKEAREKEKAKEMKKILVVKNVQTKAATAGPKNVEQHSPLLHVPDDAMRQILSFLPAQELGTITLSCLAINRMLKEVRIPYILSRLNRANQPLKGAVGYVDMCRDQAQARALLEQSFGGGDTGRLISKKCKRSGDTDEFVAYARYLEECVCGYAPMVRHNRFCYKQDKRSIVSSSMLLHRVFVERIPKCCLRMSMDDSLLYHRSILSVVSVGMVNSVVLEVVAWQHGESVNEDS